MLGRIIWTIVFIIAIIIVSLIYFDKTLSISKDDDKYIIEIQNDTNISETSLENIYYRNLCREHLNNTNATFYDVEQNATSITIICKTINMFVVIDKKIQIK